MRVEHRHAGSATLTCARGQRTEAHGGARSLHRLLALATDAAMWGSQQGSRARMQAAVLGAIFALGLGVRAAGYADLLVSFHSTRQFHCALIARALYYRWTRAAADPVRQSAEQASERRGELEPPLVQGLAAGAYRALGGEHLGVPRVLGSAFWVTGALLLYALARRLLGSVLALLAPAYFLLVPFGVVASQSFQPDPLMLLAMIASWLAIVRLDQRPARRAVWLAGALSGAAVLIKPVCVFQIAGLYLGLWSRSVITAVREERAREPRRSWLRALARGLRERGPLAWGALCLLPTAAWYVPGLLWGGRLHGQAEQSFMPELLHTAKFWEGWRLHLLGVSGGPVVVAAALLGSLLAPAGRARVALGSIAGGYVAYGLTFNYHIHTHDYYQLPLLPLIGLGLAALGARMWALGRGLVRHGLRLGVVLGALALLGLALGEIRADIWPRTHTQWNDERGYTEIGALVQHSPKVVFLTPNASGGPLEFVAGLSGWYWPCAADLRRNKRRGRPPFDWQKTWQERLSQGAEYFVITPADELGKQPGLAQLLGAHPKLSDSPRYLVYDLRRSP